MFCFYLEYVILAVLFQGQTWHSRGTSGFAGISGYLCFCLTSGHSGPTHVLGNAVWFRWERRRCGTTCVPRLWEVEQGIAINHSPFPCQDFALIEHFIFQREGFGSVHNVLAWN